MTASLCFQVTGKALPAGSKTAVPITKGGARVGTRVVESGNRSAKAAWRADIQEAARRAIATLGEEWPMDAPMQVIVTVYRARPSSQLNSKGEPKPSAPPFPTTRPDLLKLARAIEDALTGIAWHDDSQIVDEHLHKRYGDRDELTVEVAVLP